VNTGRRGARIRRGEAKVRYHIEGDADLNRRTAVARIADCAGMAAGPASGDSSDHRF
jgi:hypothetical protein